MVDNYATANFAVQNATGQTAQRTLAARLSDAYNVRDFGAKGDGNTDDWQNITNAMTAAANSGKIGGNLKQGGMVYFPPGEYHVTKTITPQVFNSFVSLVGAGRWNTAITGTLAGQFILAQFFGDLTSITWTAGSPNFATVTTHFAHKLGTNNSTFAVSIVGANVAGYNGTFTATITGASTFTYPLPVNPGSSATSGQWESAGSFDFISNLAFENFSNDNSANIVGAVRGAAQQSTTYLNCYFNGFFGLDCGEDGTFETSVHGCKFDGPSSLAGSIGYQGPSRLYGCSIFTYDTGAFFTSFGSVSIGNRIENCNVGYQIGSATAIAYGAIIGGSSEQVNTGVYVINSGGFSIIGLGITGTVGNGQLQQDYGIRFGSTPGQVTVDSVNVSVTPINTAGIDVSAVTSTAAQICFRSVNVVTPTGGGVAWKMPTAAKTTFVFENCNNPAHVLAFADLPSAAAANEGQIWNINNNSATPGFRSTANGTGSTHVSVRSDGSNWLVMG